MGVYDEKIIDSCTCHSHDTASNGGELGMGSEGIDGKYYIDLDSIQADTLVNGTAVMTAWMQIEFKQAEDLDGKKYWTTRACPYLDNEAKNRLNRQQNKANCADNIGILSNNLTQFCQI